MARVGGGRKNVAEWQTCREEPKTTCYIKKDEQVRLALHKFNVVAIEHSTCGDYGNVSAVSPANGGATKTGKLHGLLG